MLKRLNVLKGSDVVFSFDFPSGDEWQFPTYAKIALEAFHRAHPTVGLADEDVVISFEEVEELGRP